MNSLDNLATQVIYQKYCRGRETPKTFKYDSHIWQDIGKGWYIFSRFSRWCLGKGGHISFWHDVWTPFSPLRHLREVVSGPITCSQSERKIESIIDQGQWNFQILSLTLLPVSEWISKYLLIRIIRIGRIL